MNLIIATCRMKTENDERNKEIVKKFYSVKTENKNIVYEMDSKKLLVDKMAEEIDIQKQENLKNESLLNIKKSKHKN